MLETGSIAITKYTKTGYGYSLVIQEPMKDGSSGCFGSLKEKLEVNF